jgi:hypothetical protein
MKLFFIILLVCCALPFCYGTNYTGTFTVQNPDGDTLAKRNIDLAILDNFYRYHFYPTDSLSYPPTYMDCGHIEIKNNRIEFKTYLPRVIWCSTLMQHQVDVAEMWYPVDSVLVLHQSTDSLIFQKSDTFWGEKRTYTYALKKETDTHWLYSKIDRKAYGKWTKKMGKLPTRQLRQMEKITDHLRLFLVNSPFQFNDHLSTVCLKTTAPSTLSKLEYEWYSDSAVTFQYVFKETNSTEASITKKLTDYGIDFKRVIPTTAVENVLYVTCPNFYRDQLYSFGFEASLLSEF